MQLSDLNKQGFPTTPSIDEALTDLLARLQALESAYGSPFTVDSGLRSIAHQQAIYAQINANRAASGLAPVAVPLGSRHLSGQAADIADVTGDLWAWCMGNIPILEVQNIYLEDRGYTPTWVHMQSVAPGSGKRIFIPY